MRLKLTLVPFPEGDMRHFETTLSFRELQPTAGQFNGLIESMSSMTYRPVHCHRNEAKKKRSDKVDKEKGKEQIEDQDWLIPGMYEDA